LLCGYDVDFSSAFAVKDKQPLSQAISTTFKKIRDDNKIDIVPKKGKYARHENARDLFTKLLEKRNDMAIINNVANDRIDKISMESVEIPEQSVEKVPESDKMIVNDMPAVSREGHETKCLVQPVLENHDVENVDLPERTIPSVKISVPVEITIGTPSILDLQQSISKNIEATVAIMIEQMKTDMLVDIIDLVNARVNAIAPIPIKQEPAKETLPVTTIEQTEKPHLHLVVIDLNHLYLFAKNTRLYYSNAWLDGVLRNVYTNVVATTKKLGMPFDINNVIGKMFIIKKNAFLEKHIEDFAIDSKDMALRAFPGRFIPWKIISGDKHYKGREVELDVDTWIVKEIDINILKRYRGKIATLHLVSGDKDMLPAVETAREEGVHATVMSYKRAMAMEMMAKASDAQYIK